MKKIFSFKRWKIAILILLLLVVGVWIYLRPYQPEPIAVQAMENSKESTITVDHNRHWIRFKPLHDAEPAVIFYPGGLVDETAYAPFARAIAEAGHTAYIVKMPLDLAVLGGNRAEKIVNTEPYQQYVIGGHSLGGVMASRYAVTHPDHISGVFFLASYADKKGSLASADLPVLSIVGSKDQVLNYPVYEENKVNLPPNTVFYTIEGGNHSQFGSYGMQKGDGTPGISADKQLTQTVDQLLQWMP